MMGAHGYGSGAGSAKKYRLIDGVWTLQINTEYEADGYVISDAASEMFWSNFDILNSDGTLYLAASEPVPVSTWTPDPVSMTMGWLIGRRIAGQRKKREQWEVRFEGELTTVEPETSNGATSGQQTYSTTDMTPMFVGGDIIRLTVNGESAVFTAIQYGEGSDTQSGGTIGNEWLNYINPENGGTDSTEDDTGYDYFLFAWWTDQIIKEVNKFLFQSREPGTYHVKVERKVT